MKDFQNGLTLIELLICIAVLSITFTLSAHSIPGWINHARLTSSLNNLVGVIQFAKAHAIIEGESTTVCPIATDGTCNRKYWGQSTVAFVDRNNNKALDSDEQVIRYVDKSSNKIMIRSSRDQIVFYGDGLLSSPISVYICLFDHVSELSRGFTISLQGRIKSSKDKDKNGLHELNGNKEIRCT
ncbi:MAG: GspH/FimT family pseudopilin [Pseudomonadota bacterium]